MLNLATACALKIALQQRFEHQHERIAFRSAQLLPDDVLADLDHLSQRGGHWSSALSAGSLVTW